VVIVRAVNLSWPKIGKFAAKNANSQIIVIVCMCRTVDVHVVCMFLFAGRLMEYDSPQSAQ